MRFLDDTGPINLPLSPAKLHDFKSSCTLTHLKAQPWIADFLIAAAPDSFFFSGFGGTGFPYRFLL